MLAVQRSNFMDQAGKWEFPGGKMKIGESEEESLIREIEEELTIKVLPIQRLTPTEHRFNEEKCIQLIPYICTIKEGEVTLKEHRNMAWLDKELLIQLDWCEPDIPVVHQVINLGNR